MNLVDLFQETIWSLQGNRLRSGLTVLGIVIGIGSVIALISIGQGAKLNIQNSIQSIGSNLIVVTPGVARGSAVSAGRGSAQTLTQSDADAITTQVTEAVGVAPESTRRYQVTAKGTNTNTQVIGTVAAYTTVRNVTISDGDFITDDQAKQAAKVAVLGPTTRDDLFGVDASAIGQTIRINNTIFKIIGITEAKGGSGFTNPDDAVYIPISAAQRYLSGGNFVTTISVSAQDQASMAAVQQHITDVLLQRHNISDATQADFTVLNQADIVSTASSVTNTFTSLLASVAGISLLVGGIGIMNMMFTSVTERTREIGLRKSIGAKRKDISIQFLAEAVTLTVFGGILGVVFGWIASVLASQFAGLTTSITLSSIALAVGVSAAVGIVFGYYPARRAAQLNPIEALRYE